MREDPKFLKCAIPAKTASDARELLAELAADTKGDNSNGKQ